MVQDWLVRARCAAVTTLDLTRWSIAGEIARPVAVSAPDQAINPVLCATGPGSANARKPAHHDEVDAGHRRREPGADADAAAGGARDRRHAHPRLWSPTAVHRRPRLTRAVGAASGQDREKAAAWGEGGGLAILVPCSTPLFSPSPGQQD
jgi:hypothetical protein